MAKKIRPRSQTARIEAEINRLAGEVFERNRELLALGEGWVPVVDISESETEIIVEAELPGIADSDVQLVLHSNRLEIKGVKREILGHSRVKYFRLERDADHQTRDSRGLGLVFCRLAAKAQGGAIWVEEGEDGGNCFCLRLPVPEGFRDTPFHRPAPRPGSAGS